MHRSFLCLLFYLLYATNTCAQDQYGLDARVELGYGVLDPPTDWFPESKQVLGIFFELERSNWQSKDHWAHYLKQPTTGFSLGVMDFGNRDKIGRSLIGMPYIRFPIFGSKRMHLRSGMGLAVVSEEFDRENNRDNVAVATDITWAFRLDYYYRILRSRTLDWEVGIGYFHHSNGHVRLPNHGLNSLSINSSVKFHARDPYQKKREEPADISRTAQYFFQLRSGFGHNVLSREFNTKKPVYTLAVSAGKIYNRTFKIGLGMQYRFYQHYYDYIQANEDLVREAYPELREQAFLNASAFNIFGSAEILMNHVGIDLQLGVNLFKPFYKIDRQLGSAFYYYVDGEERYVYAKLDLDYKLKQYFSNRLAINYYLKSTQKAPKWNMFAGVAINANSGQADFNELSIGLVYRWPEIERPKH